MQENKTNKCHNQNSQNKVFYYRICRSTGINRVIRCNLKFYVVGRIFFFYGFQFLFCHIGHQHCIGIILFLNGNTDGILTIDTIDKFLFGHSIFHFSHVHYFYFTSVGSSGNHCVAKLVQTGVFSSQTYRIDLF